MNNKSLPVVTFGPPNFTVEKWKTKAFPLLHSVPPNFTVEKWKTKADGLSHIKAPGATLPLRPTENGFEVKPKEPVEWREHWSWKGVLMENQKMTVIPLSKNCDRRGLSSPCGLWHCRSRWHALNTENHRNKFRQVHAHLTELTPFFCSACAPDCRHWLARFAVCPIDWPTPKAPKLAR